MKLIHKLTLKNFGAIKVTFYRTEEPEIVRLIPMDQEIRDNPIFADTGILEEHCADAEEYHRLMHKIFRKIVIMEARNDTD